MVTEEDFCQKLRTLYWTSRFLYSWTRCIWLFHTVLAVREFLCEYMKLNLSSIIVAHQCM